MTFIYVSYVLIRKCFYSHSLSLGLTVSQISKDIFIFILFLCLDTCYNVRYIWTYSILILCSTCEVYILLVNFMSYV